MNKTTIVTVIGARPQFVKAAVVSDAIRADGRLREIIVHTGQHYDENMSQVFFEELGIPQPDHNLAVGSGSHGVQTARMIEGLEKVLLQIGPAALLTYGDTNSTLASAIAASKLGIPIAHVEAGLRSFNRAMPEEINRIVTDKLSSLLFAPTKTAVDQLVREGVSLSQIFLTGDVMYDATIKFLQIAMKRRLLENIIPLSSKSFVLFTLHRAENTDDKQRFAIIMEMVQELSVDVPIVFPMHPRTRARYEGEFGSGVHILPPLGYLDMLLLESNSRVIVTDSGGVQKEALFHRVPCVTLRTETEWTETLQHGWNRLAPPVAVETLLATVRDALVEVPNYDGASALFGDGHASKLIVEEIGRFLTTGRVA